MAKTLRLTLLGGLHVARGEAELEGFVSRKARALLAYLAVTGRPHFRDALAGLLWGTATEERAAGNLRVVLSNLRQIVPHHVVITRQMAAFDRESDYWLDVEAFQERVDKSLLREAVDLYQGDFLEGFYVRGAPAFEEWVSVERERLRQMVLQALHCLVRHHAARGEYAAGIEYATRLLALDPWREEAHRELMRLQALSGQRSAALAQYEECRRLLEAELGLEPLEETKALYGRLVDWGTGKWEYPSTILPMYQFTSLPFTGREEEHAQLVTWWERTRPGQGGLALVAGEAGVGKTRLVEEVIRYAEAQGAVVLRGRCYEFGSGVPYQPIAEALRSILDSRFSTPNRQPPTPNLEPVWLVELSRLLPGLRQLCPGLPEPIPVSGEAIQQRLFEAVARFLLAICNLRSAICLFLDDLHWADQSTLDLLHYLVRQLAGAPVWIVGTYRLEEVSLSHPLARLRQGLSRDHLVDRLTLEPLSPTAVEQIACFLVGDEEGAALGAVLHRESEGNPFILVETVSDLQEQGALRDEGDGRWRWAGPPAEELALSKVEGTLPAGVRDVVLQRVGRLSEPAQRLLTLAAVVGRGFDTALLQAAAGPDADAVDESLDEWLTRRLVQLHSASALQPPTSNPSATLRTGLQLPTSNLQYDFSHDKIRAAVYHAAGDARRRMLHQRVGAALENLYVVSLEDVYEQLAHHYEQAGLIEQALTYLPLAAAKATAVYAHQEALAYHDRALALLGEGDARRWEPLLQRGRVLRFLSRYDEALAACRLVVEAGDASHQLLAAQAANELSTICRVRRDYDEARAWGARAYRLAEEAGEVREQARAKQVLGEVEREQGNLETAQEQLEEALACYRTLADRHGVAECLHGLGHVFSSWVRYDEARERFGEALAVFRDLGDRQREAACLRAIGMAHWRQLANEASHQAFAESLAICRTIGDREGEAQCLNDLGLVYLVLVENDEVRRCWQESAALFQALGLEKRAASCLHRLGILHQSDGNYAASQQCLEESLAVNRAAGAKANEALDLGWLGRLYLMRGAYDEARRCLERALALGREIGGSEEESWQLTWLGAVAYETGNLTEARDHLQKAIQLGGERDANMKPDDAWRCLALVHLARGDGPAALAAARQAVTESEKKPFSHLHWSTELGRAMLGTVYASGLLAEAEDPRPYFEQVLTTKKNTNPYNYSAILRRYGAYLLRSGERERGEARLRQALSILERIGAQEELDKVRRLLAGDDAYHLRW